MQNDTAPDGEKWGHEYGEAAGVIHGRVNLNPVSRPQLPGDHRAVSVPSDLPVWNHYALRSSGGAAGVEQAENIVGLEFRCERIWPNPTYGFGITQCFWEIGLLIQANEVLEAHELLELLREFFVPCGVHEAARSAVREYLSQLASCAACAERDEDDAGFARCPKGIDIFNPIFGKEADTIPRNKRAEVRPDPRAPQGPPI